MIRQWIGEKLMALAVRLLDPEKFIKDIEEAPPEKDEEDWDIAVHPAVTLGPKALAMLEYARMSPSPTEVKKPVYLRGSLQDRYQRALRQVR